MRKNNNMFSFVILIAAIALLTGCGKEKPAPEATTTDTETESSYPGEGKVTGGIKDDAEIISLQNEEKNNDIQLSANVSDEEIVTLEANEQETSEASVPAITGSVDPADYWHGDDYFDLVGYLTANNFWSGKYILDPTKGPQKVDSNPNMYVCYSKDDPTWVVHIGTEYFAGMMVMYLNDGSGEGLAITPTNGIADSSVITIDEEGNKMRDYTIRNTIAVVEAIKAHPHDTNPIQSTNEYKVREAE